MKAKIQQVFETLTASIEPFLGTNAMFGPKTMTEAKKKNLHLAIAQTLNKLQSYQHIQNWNLSDMEATETTVGMVIKPAFPLHFIQATIVLTSDNRVVATVNAGPEIVQREFDFVEDEKLWQ